MSYRFYSHFHPFVANLVKRLTEGSVSGLQAADTVYAKGRPGTVKRLPDSITVELAADLVVGEGSQTVKAGTAMVLADTQTAPASNNLVSEGEMVLTPQKGIRASGNRTISFGSQVTLPPDTKIILPSGAPFTLKNPVAATITGCKPRPELYEDIFSPTSYNPSDLVRQPYPVKDLDFTSGGAYSIYNWELFFHAPIIIAIHLSKNQRFDDAQRWFHYVFDPTDDSDGPTPERFWKVKPFQFTDVAKIEEILVNLSTGADPALQTDTVKSIEAWKEAPFRPHVIARYRQSAYMFKTVMAYLDNLIAWGDSLFRQDTGESINEATQLYVLAANILGPRPQAVPKKGSVRPQTYASLQPDLNKFSEALVQFESDIAFDLTPPPNAATDTHRLIALRSISNALYFCVPRNDKLLSYWDTVADRLFKIHNSLNILGIFRQLPLFEPPIDPALLARAAAAGLDVGAVVSGANQPLPLVRFQFLVQKAAEISQEVKSLGSNLLSVIEKEDNEKLAILRAKHERVILGMAETVKYSQLQEAIKAREGLEKSLANAAQRYFYYERELGRDESELTMPSLEALDSDGLDKMKFKASEPELTPRAINVNISQGPAGVIGGKKISTYELSELQLLKAARDLQDQAIVNELLSAEMALIPEFGTQVEPLGVGASVKFGGMFLAKMFSMMAMVNRGAADQLTYSAGNAARLGSYDRREQEWAFQSNLAAGEINQLFKQLRAAQIREAIAEREWKNHQQQIKHAEEIEQFLANERTGKKTNQAFYTFLKREVKGLYGQCFQFAFDVARKAERALQNELGDSSLSFLQFGYLAGKEGLLAGEKLYFDIKRMEMAYHDLNQREYEMTRHASLLQVNPLALVQLRATGRCTFSLPEELFDLDAPGHYFRRIKSVAVSIPCVAGPYSSVNCTLTLLKSSIRKSALLGEEGYPRQGDDTQRFSDHFGSVQSIVTSSAQNDSGLFETSLRDERSLPFEWSGAISEWQLELPAGVRQFDYDTISDVILHLRYTAREGGGLLRNFAAANLKARIAEAQTIGSARLLSVRHEFPTEWAKFKSAAASTNPPPFVELSITLKPEHYPFWSKGRLNEIKRMDLFARASKPSIEVSRQPDGNGDNDTLDRDPSLNGILRGELTSELPPPVGKFALYFSDNAIADLWLVLTWA